MKVFQFFKFNGLLLTLLLLSTFNHNVKAEDSVVSIPNQHPFELYHRRLLPELASVLAPGAQAFDSTFSWSNTYNFRTDSFFVDAESREVSLKYRRGITDNLTFAADIGVRMVDGGITDSFIQSWDSSLGAAINRRDHRGKNNFQVEAQTNQGNKISIDRKPIGLTDARIGTRYSLISDKITETELTMGMDLTLPSHLETYGQDSIDLRYSLIGSQRSGRFLFFGNLGAAYYGDGQEDGFTFDEGSLDAVLGVIIFLSDNWSIQLDQLFETSAVDNVRRYPSWTSYFDILVQYQLCPNWILSVGVRENPINGRETTDVTGILGLKYSWAS